MADFYNDWRRRYHLENVPGGRLPHMTQFFRGVKARKLDAPDIATRQGHGVVILQTVSSNGR